jgi:hypothetical protein
MKKHEYSVYKINLGLASKIKCDTPITFTIQNTEYNTTIVADSATHHILTRRLPVTHLERAIAAVADECEAVGISIFSLIIDEVNREVADTIVNISHDASRKSRLLSLLLRGGGTVSDTKFLVPVLHKGTSLRTLKLTSTTLDQLINGGLTDGPFESDLTLVLGDCRPDGLIQVSQLIAHVGFRKFQFLCLTHFRADMIPRVFDDIPFTAPVMGSLEEVLEDAGYGGRMPVHHFSSFLAGCPSLKTLTIHERADVRTLIESISRLPIINSLSLMSRRCLFAWEASMGEPLLASRTLRQVYISGSGTLPLWLAQVHQGVRDVFAPRLPEEHQTMIENTIAEKLHHQEMVALCSYLQLDDLYRELLPYLRMEDDDEEEEEEQLQEEEEEDTIDLSIIFPG